MLLSYTLISIIITFLTFYLLIETKRFHSKHFFDANLSILGRSRYLPISPSESFDNPGEITDQNEDQQTINSFNNGNNNYIKSNDKNQSIVKNRRVDAYKSLNKIEKHLSINSGTEGSQVDQQHSKKSKRQSMKQQKQKQEKNLELSSSSKKEDTIVENSLNSKNSASQKQVVSFLEVNIYENLRDLCCAYYRQYEENFQILIFIFFKKNFLCKKTNLMKLTKFNIHKYLILILFLFQ